METFKSSKAYIAALRGRGFKVIGMGFFSMVLGKPGCSQVVKVCRDRDDVWPLYAEWAFHNPGPLVPRILSLKWHGEGQDAFFVAVLDRMDETVHDRRFNMTVRQDLRDDAELFCDALARNSTGLSHCLKALDRKGFGEVADLLRRLREVFPYAYFDIHAANWMYDASGALILTDPFSEDKMKVEPKRLKHSRSTAPASLAA